MKKNRNFFKSLRFFIFLVVIIIGIAAVFILWGVYLTHASGRGMLAAVLILTAAIVAAALLVSFFMTKPLNRLIRSMNEVQDGFEDDFQPVSTYSETELISDACSAMLQRLKVLDRTQQEFVSNVSHELKTPLTSMKVLADSLVGRDDVPVEVYQEFMEDIGEEIDRENEIIDDLLSFVRLDKSSAELNLSVMQIDELVEQIVKQIVPIAQSMQVELSLVAAPALEAEVDEVKLTLALTNLIENAVKYNHPGGWVHVSLDTDHQNFYITVSDNGIGIPKEAQEQIFERFYRADKSRSDEISGTGLGLSLARNVVLLHRGSIKVKSEPGEGSEFTVRIPLTQTQSQ